MQQRAIPDGTLTQWLDYQQSLHVSTIELGLDRVRRVARRLNLLDPSHQVMTVAGTNGKGSCVALLTGLLSGKHRVGCYTSPHLWRYNERIVVAGQPVTDALLIQAFEAVEQARGETALTFFEFGTLAALWIFADQQVDIAILEVGLGGRLDAVNILAADVALITSIGLDHTAWLGHDREAIGYEKAGIMRAGKPVLCGDRNPPESLLRHAETCQASLSCLGRDFDMHCDAAIWHWRHGRHQFEVPAHRAVHADNLALAIAAALLLEPGLDHDDVANACTSQMQLPGRREIIDGPVTMVYDVGHNAEAIALLVAQLQQQSVAGATHVVLGMLTDKPVTAVGTQLARVADYWYPAGLDGITERGLSGESLAARLGCAARWHANPAAALAAARAAAEVGDRIVICGSFFTVAQVRKP